MQQVAVGVLAFLGFGIRPNFAATIIVEDAFRSYCDWFCQLGGGWDNCDIGLATVSGGTCNEQYGNTCHYDDVLKPFGYYWCHYFKNKCLAHYVSGVYVPSYDNVESLQMPGLTFTKWFDNDSPSEKQITVDFDESSQAEAHFRLTTSLSVSFQNGKKFTAAVPNLLASSFTDSFHLYSDNTSTQSMRGVRTQWTFSRDITVPPQTTMQVQLTLNQVSVTADWSGFISFGSATAKLWCKRKVVWANKGAHNEWFFGASAFLPDAYDDCAGDGCTIRAQFEGTYISDGKVSSQPCQLGSRDACIPPGTCKTAADCHSLAPYCFLHPGDTHHKCTPTNSCAEDSDCPAPGQAWCRSATCTTGPTLPQWLFARGDDAINDGCIPRAIDSSVLKLWSLTDDRLGDWTERCSKYLALPNNATVSKLIAQPWWNATSMNMNITVESAIPPLSYIAMLVESSKNGKSSSIFSRALFDLTFERSINETQVAVTCGRSGGGGATPSSRSCDSLAQAAAVWLKVTTPVEMYGQDTDRSDAMVLSLWQGLGSLLDAYSGMIGLKASTNVPSFAPDWYASQLKDYVGRLSSMLQSAESAVQSGMILKGLQNTINAYHDDLTGRSEVDAMQQSDYNGQIGEATASLASAKEHIISMQKQGQDLMEEMKKDGQMQLGFDIANSVAELAACALDFLGGEGNEAEKAAETAEKAAKESMKLEKMAKAGEKVVEASEETTQKVAEAEKKVVKAAKLALAGERGGHIEESIMELVNFARGIKDWSEENGKLTHEDVNEIREDAATQGPAFWSQYVEDAIESNDLYLGGSLGTDAAGVGHAFEASVHAVADAGQQHAMASLHLIEATNNRDAAKKAISGINKTTAAVANANKTMAGQLVALHDSLRLYSLWMIATGINIETRIQLTCRALGYVFGEHIDGTPLPIREFCGVQPPVPLNLARVPDVDVLQHVTGYLGRYRSMLDKYVPVQEQSFLSQWQNVEETTVFQVGGMVLPLQSGNCTRNSSKCPTNCTPVTQSDCWYTTFNKTVVANISKHNASLKPPEPVDPSHCGGNLEPDQACGCFKPIAECQRPLASMGHVTSEQATSTKVAFTIMPNQHCTSSYCEVVDQLKSYDLLFLVGFQAFIPGVDIGTGGVKFVLKSLGPFVQVSGLDITNFSKAVPEGIPFGYHDCLPDELSEVNIFDQEKKWCNSAHVDTIQSMAMHYDRHVFAMPTLYSSYELEIRDAPRSINAKDVKIALWARGRSYWAISAYEMCDANKCRRGTYGPCFRSLTADQTDCVQRGAEQACPAGYTDCMKHAHTILVV